MNLHESLKSRSDIAILHERFCQQMSPQNSFLGGANSDDLCFLYDAIVAARPENFLEVGVATGLSSSFIGRFLELNGGASFTGIDVSDRFYGDASKNVGFLIEELLPAPTIAFEIWGNRTLLDLE